MICFRFVLCLWAALRRKQYRYVFILGHIRSGSTLVAHILASHPDFAGAGETHTRYRTAEDLPKLVFKTCKLLRRPVMRESYVVDQINHAYVSDEALRAPQLYRCIILVREPERALKSMVGSLNHSENKALKIYATRLEELAHYATVLGDRAMLVDYDELVDRTEETLATMTRFLGIDPPLSPAYKTHRMTRRNGDPSLNIKAGKTFRTKSADFAISEETLTAAKAAEDNCRRRLQRFTAQSARSAT